jgi:hypothetical protein
MAGVLRTSQKRSKRSEVCRGHFLDVVAVGRDRRGRRLGDPQIWDAAVVDVGRTRRLGRHRERKWCRLAWVCEQDNYPNY